MQVLLNWVYWHWQIITFAFERPMQNRGPLYWKILECSAAVRLFWIYGLCFFLWPIGVSLRLQMIFTSDKKGVGWFFPSAFFLPTLFHFKSLLLGRPKLAKSPIGPNGLQVSSTQMINIRGATTTTVGRGPRLSVLPDVTPQLFTAILPPWHSVEIPWFFYHPDFTWNQFSGF